MLFAGYELSFLTNCGLHSIIPKNQILKFIAWVFNYFWQQIL